MNLFFSKFSLSGAQYIFFSWEFGVLSEKTFFKWLACLFISISIWCFNLSGQHPLTNTLVYSNDLMLTRLRVQCHIRKKSLTNIQITHIFVRRIYFQSTLQPTIQSFLLARALYDKYLSWVAVKLAKSSPLTSEVHGYKTSLGYESFFFSRHSMSHPRCALVKCLTKSFFRVELLPIKTVCNPIWSQTELWGVSHNMVPLACLSTGWRRRYTDNFKKQLLRIEDHATFVASWGFCGSTQCQYERNTHFWGQSRLFQGGE